ncbi:hypothetical protein HGQ17_13910 [Nesterenkonia sp. MY13]|uniref:Uncharacterized protein n=1 Tax=Nesterenkonia sedimenti TaxID=1463632 RepID=A0A7X8TM22_9MICC|nr:hypothetical protein [Nesterenkonia sedimenti]NLS11070.1 hypothetical protein [Nesterenkonia sedimenti]
MSNSDGDPGEGRWWVMADSDEGVVAVVELMGVGLEDEDFQQLEDSLEFDPSVELDVSQLD